jgi:dTDP-4-amino-4,6-dideoxygalactose transaminase
MIPIFKPYMPNGLTAEIERILYSGKLAYGEYGKMFENKLTDYIGNKNVLTVSTYNQALLIILSTLDLKEGDEVIVSPVSCLASNQPFAIKGVKIVWADVEPETGALSVDDVKNKITKKTKAIFHNQYCGFLGHIDEINQLGKQFGIPIVDDCIEAFGSELNGQKTGSLGTDITVFSFQTVRLPNTIDGGAIVFKDVALFEKAKMIRDYGIDRTTFRDELNEINPKCDIKLEGYGALMSEVNSLIGLKQMDDISNLIQKQRNNANEWDGIIDKMNDVKKIKLTKSTMPNYWVYGILAKNKTETIKKFRALGYYATSVHINNNIYSVFNNNIELKGVNEFMNHYVALPCGWWLNENDINKTKW